MWITISTSSHPFLHTHSSSWCSSLPIRAYHRTAISTVVLFWATSSHGFQYNNCLQLMTSSVKDNSIQTQNCMHRGGSSSQNRVSPCKAFDQNDVDRGMSCGGSVGNKRHLHKRRPLKKQQWCHGHQSATYCFLSFKVFPKCGCSLGHSPATVCIMCSERTNPHGWRPKDPILLLQNQTFSCTPLLHSSVLMHISTPLEVTHAPAVEIYIASKFITGLNSLLHKPWSDNRILQNGTEWMINLKDIHYAPSHFPYFK